MKVPRISRGMKTFAVTLGFVVVGALLLELLPFNKHALGSLNGESSQLLRHSGSGEDVAPMSGSDVASGRSAASPLTFGVIGDWGVTDSKFASFVGEEYAQMIPNVPPVSAALAAVAEQRKFSFVVSTGDQKYPHGVPKEANLVDVMDETFEKIFDQPSLIEIPWYPTFGNHDCEGDEMSQVRYTKLQPKREQGRWQFPKRYYSKVISKPSANVIIQLVVLDTCTLVCTPSMSNRTGDTNHRCNGPLQKYGNKKFMVIRERQLLWLQNSLKVLPKEYLKAKHKAAAAREAGKTVADPTLWKLVVGHWPIFSTGGNGPTGALVEDVLPILIHGGVQAYLSGHDHNLQHLQRPADGTTPHMFVSGAGGYTVHKSLKKTAPANFNDGVISHGFFKTHGFMAVTADENQLKFEFASVVTPRDKNAVDGLAHDIGDGRLGTIVYTCVLDSKGGIRSKATPNHSIMMSG